MFSPESFAKVKHEGQKYGDKDYYLYHITQVATMVAEGCNVCENMLYEKNNLVSVAYLHDVLEDTSATYEELECLFGTLIADAVLAITKVKGEGYHDYLRRVNENQYARTVKKFDIVFNLSNSIISLISSEKGSLDRDTAKKRVDKYLEGLTLLRSGF